MNSETQFMEVQAFRQPWLWFMLGLIQLLFGWILVEQIIFEKPVGDNPAPNGVIIALFVVFSSINFLFWKVKLLTIINENGVYYKFSPFQLKFKYHTWDSIQFCYTRIYKPISEFGGWGYRWGFKKGRAFSVSGNTGLQVVLKDKSEILIGTGNEEELKAFLKSNQLWKMPNPEVQT